MGRRDSRAPFPEEARPAQKERPRGRQPSINKSPSATKSTAIIKSRLLEGSRDLVARRKRSPSRSSLRQRLSKSATNLVKGHGPGAADEHGRDVALGSQERSDLAAGLSSSYTAQRSPRRSDLSGFSPSVVPFLSSGEPRNKMSFRKHIQQTTTAMLNIGSGGNTTKAPLLNGDAIDEDIMPDRGRRPQNAPADGCRFDDGDSGGGYESEIEVGNSAFGHTSNHDPQLRANRLDGDDVSKVESEIEAQNRHFGHTSSLDSAPALPPLTADDHHVSAAPSVEAGTGPNVAPAMDGEANPPPGYLGIDIPQPQHQVPRQLLPLQHPQQQAHAGQEPASFMIPVPPPPIPEEMPLGRAPNQAPATPPKFPMPPPPVTSAPSNAQQNGMPVTRKTPPQQPPPPPDKTSEKSGSGFFGIKLLHRSSSSRAGTGTSLISKRKSAGAVPVTIPSLPPSPTKVAPATSGAHIVRVGATPIAWPRPSSPASAAPSGHNTAPVAVESLSRRMQQPLLQPPIQAQVHPSAQMPPQMPAEPAVQLEAQPPVQALPAQAATMPPAPLAHLAQLVPAAGNRAIAGSNMPRPPWPASAQNKPQSEEQPLQVQPPPKPQQQQQAPCDSCRPLYEATWAQAETKMYALSSQLAAIHQQSASQIALLHERDARVVELEALVKRLRTRIQEQVKQLEQLPAGLPGLNGVISGTVVSSGSIGQLPDSEIRNRWKGLRWQISQCVEARMAVLPSSIAGPVPADRAPFLRRLTPEYERYLGSRAGSVHLIEAAIWTVLAENVFSGARRAGQMFWAAQWANSVSKFSVYFSCISIGHHTLTSSR